MKRKLMGIAVWILSLAFFVSAAGDPAPEWAEVLLNDRGFLDGGTYVLQDPEGGHWMYVDDCLRVQVVRTRETPERERPRDAKQDFLCFTTEIWYDPAKDPGPVTLWADPEKPGNTGIRKSVAQIAQEQQAVFAVSTDLFTARISMQTCGVVIRNGLVLQDRRNRHFPGQRPPQDTLALYADGHIDSFLPAEKKAEVYLAEGALQVYTFGPVLVRDGEIQEEVLRYDDRALNPMHAFGMAEPGHFIDVLCEGRLKSVNGSTGVMTSALAAIMKERGCRIAVNLDGGSTAVIAFMGQQLNAVAQKPAGRVTCEVLAFGAGKAEKTEKMLDTGCEE